MTRHLLNYGKLLLLASSFLLLGCPSKNARPAHLSGNEQATPAATEVLLGQPFDSKSIRVLDVGPGSFCLASTDAEYAGGPSARFDSQFSQSFSSVLSEVGIRGSGGVTIGIFSGEIGIGFAHAVSDSDLKTAFYNVFNFDAGSLRLTRKMLTPFGKSLIESKAGSLERRARCGDAYVDQVRYGAKFMVGMVLHFKDHVTKEKFMASIKVKVGFITIFSMSWSDEMYDAMKDVAVEIVAYQVGGGPSPEEFLARHADPDVRNGTAVCTAKEEGRNFIEPCLKRFQALSTYGKTEFKRSLSEGMVELRLGRPSPALPVVGFETMPYDESGFWPLQPRDSSQLSEADKTFQALNFIESADDYYGQRVREFQLRQKHFPANPELDAALVVAESNLHRTGSVLDTCEAKLEGETSLQSAKECFDVIRSLVGETCEHLKPMQLDAADDPSDKSRCNVISQTE